MSAGHKAKRPEPLYLRDFIKDSESEISIMGRLQIQNQTLYLRCPQTSADNRPTQLATVPIKGEEIVLLQGDERLPGGAALSLARGDRRLLQTQPALRCSSGFEFQPWKPDPNLISLKTKQGQGWDRTAVLRMWPLAPLCGLLAVKYRPLAISDQRWIF